VAVVSLMTAAAVGQVAEQGTAGYAVAALTLAVLSGGILLAGPVPEAGLSRQFPQPSGHRGLHHRLGHPDRRQPAQAYPRRRGAWPHLPEILGSLNEHMTEVNPITLSHRRGGDRRSCSGCARG
jgi:SulP family sulfate permease